VDLGVLVQAAEDLGVHAGHAVGGVEQPFPVGIFADGIQNLADRPADAIKVDMGMRHGLGFGLGRVVEVAAVAIVGTSRGRGRGVLRHGSALMGPGQVPAERPGDFFKSSQIWNFG
jgi:hypothetical protein